MVDEVYWAGDSRHLLIDPSSFIYDVVEKQPERKMIRYVLGWSQKMTGLFTYDRNNKIFMIEDFLTGKKIAEYQDK